MALKRVWLILVLIGVFAGHVAFAQDDPTLTQTFVSADGTLTVQYPEEWFIDDGDEPSWNLITISNSLELAEGGLTSMNNLESGEVILTILAPPSVNIFFPQIQAQPSLEDVANALSEEADEGSIVSVVELQNREAVQISAPDSEKVTDAILFVMDFSGNKVIVMNAAPWGELAQYEDTILGILDTLDFGTTDKTTTFVSATSQISFEYPGDWSVVEMLPGTVIVYPGFFVEEGVVQLGPITIITPSGLPSYKAIDSTAAPIDLIDQLAELWILEEDVIFMPPEETTIGDYAAVRVDYSSPLREGFLTAFETEQGVGLVMVSAPIGQLDMTGAEIWELLESMQFE